MSRGIMTLKRLDKARESPSSIAAKLRERLLTTAARDGRFEYQRPEHHLVSKRRVHSTTDHYDIALRSEKAGKISHAVSYSRLPTHEQQLFPEIFAFDPHEETDIAISPAAEFSLRCVLHRSRPQHASGKADLLPFENASTMTALWDGLALPSSYLHLANGYLSTAQSHEIQDGDEGATGFALTVYSLSKQGDWSMALSHNSHTRSTSVFWSLQDGVDADTLVNDLCDFQDYGWHPMLLPCIMFASVLRMATERRQSIKARLQTLEKTMARINTYSADSNIAEVFEQRHFSQELKQLFELLQSCRHDQGSREGRYGFWRSFHTVIKNGFEYAKHFMQAQRAHAARAQDYDSAFAQHADLQEWFTLTWIQLESIMARDQDHNTRVDNVSDMVGLNLWTICRVLIHEPSKYAECIS